MILLCVFDIRASRTLCFTRVELLKHCVLWGFNFATCHFTMCFWDWSFQNTVFYEGRVSETLCFARVNFRDPPFSLSFWEVDVTNACYLHENRWGHNLGHTWNTAHWSEREAARNPQCKHCLGNFSEVKFLKTCSHWTFAAFRPTNVERSRQKVQTSYWGGTTKRRMKRFFWFFLPFFLTKNRGSAKKTLSPSDRA